MGLEKIPLKGLKEINKGLEQSLQFWVLKGPFPRLYSVPGSQSPLKRKKQPNNQREKLYTELKTQKRLASSI